MSKRELELRKWIKGLLGDDLSWIEPGRGGSVGMGDALVSLPDGYRLPVELKHWELDKKGDWICPMRPAQIRYHYMNHHRKKGRTAICFLIKDEVFVLDGRYVPKHKKLHDVKEYAKCVCRFNDSGISVRLRLMNLLWGGEYRK